MTKDELIAKHGIDWYERFKEKNRTRYNEMYHANPEKERERRRRRYAENPEYSKRYNEQHMEIYRINCRDRNRITLLMGINLDGLVVHHNVYHADNYNTAWFDDIAILTPEEHTKWHNEHPDFVASDHIVE